MIQNYKRIPLEDNENYLYHTDLGLSAALASVGYPLHSLDKTMPNKVLFIFKRTGGLNKAVEAYWNSSLQVDARTLFDSLKMLKSRIYSNDTRRAY